MGLLSDPKTREKVVNIISKHNNKLAILCYVAGVVYFLALAHHPFNAGVYMSENALIPGLVEADFYGDNGAAEIFRDYKEYHKQLKEKAQTDDSMLYEVPSAWLVSQMRSVGLETYVHNYTFRYPASILKDAVLTGQNVYGILRAPRAASTESVVLSVPFRPPGAEHDKTNAGMALLLAVANGFRRRTYWAKDIIFLVSDNEEVGMQAWLGAYHHAPMEYIDSGELAGRSGSIQAAINLEIGTEQVSRMNIKLEGLNGQLPNLDLVNTVNRLCRKEHIPTSIQKRPDTSVPFTFVGWQHSVQTMLHMMWSQASGSPSGNHGLFHRYHIEAVTLQGVKLKNARRNFGFEEMGRVIEGVFRSLNNLLERFHQSFFFYLLPSTDRYVSIGLYFPPFGLMAAPILIKAVALWISFAYEDKSNEEDEGKKTEGENKEKVKAESLEKDAEKEIAKQEKADELVLPTSSGFSGVVPHLVMSAVFGLGSYHSPGFFVTSASALKMGPMQGLMMGAIAVQASAMAYPYMIQRKAKQKKNLSGANWKLLKCLGLLVLGVVVFATALMNISLAFFVTLVSAPVVVSIRPSHSRCANFVQYLALFAISPLSLVLTSGLISHVMTLSPAAVTPDAIPGILGGAYRLAQQSLLYSVVNAHLYQCWTFSLITLAFWPIWLVFWSVLWSQPL